jgi:integral membrane protein (TIGR01906 family)
VNKYLALVLGLLVTLIVPFVLLFSSIRVLLTPLYVELEYSMPGFPEDSYGMTLPERRANANVALAYLLNDQGKSFLGDQQFADGSPMYNERELGHMADVKTLTRIVLNVWLGLLVLLVAVDFAALRFGWWEQFRAWMVRGAQLTIGLIITALVFVALSFNALFTGFHHLFFEGDTWLFSYSDTLIRLFPIRFWQDVFIALGVLTLAGAGFIWWVFSKKRMKVKKVEREK